MFGIDFHFHSFTLPFKKKSISLIKVDYDNYQSVYMKIPSHTLEKPKHTEQDEKKCHHKTDTSSCDIGIFNMYTDVVAKKRISNKEGDEEPDDEEDSFHKSHTICVSLYSDQQDLEQICSGKVIIDRFTPVTNNHPLFQSDSLMNCCNFVTLSEISSNQFYSFHNMKTNQLFQQPKLASNNNVAEHIFAVPLYYKTQGKYTIDGASLTMSVKIYSIDLEKLQKQLFLDAPSSCTRCHEKRKEKKFPEFEEPERVSEPPAAETSFLSKTTEDDDYSSEEFVFEEEYDSVDEFIDNFNKRHAPPPPPPQQQQVLPPPPVPQRKPRPAPKKKKKKPARPSGPPFHRTRDFVQENATFPKPLQPSRPSQIRYLRFK